MVIQRRHALDLSLGPGLIKIIGGIEVIEGDIGRLNTAICSLRATRKDSYLGYLGSANKQTVACADQILKGCEEVMSASSYD